jgi:cell division protein FtsB
MLNRTLSRLRPRTLIFLCLVYACLFLLIGAVFGRPRAKALREYARNAELKAQVQALRRANVELEREGRYYQTDDGREGIARSLGWVRPGETPVIFTH